ncbi:hypothetical protein [Cellvibrio polysaccharolyticus]|uniref:Uncharacterized protein n=1 Tax=Cellvibrio polysaccharolyticus TaxID=2082724 RepID=A0A928YVH5_9GAMM|nr:hypothetical protein [Cellvibrio polysaccharolyticus]MBE8718560.1 hypothetical protein [Cellvibrio polysaccharolyticus]
MHRTIFEVMSKSSKKRTSSKTTVGTLQTRIWLENLLRTHKISRKDFTKKIGAENGDPTGIVLRWLKGLHTVKESRVENLAKIFEGSDAPYKLPLFKLLRNRPLTKADLFKIMSPYMRISWWIFPDPKQPENMGLSFPPCLINDTDTLIERGDIYGFTAILYLVRIAEAEKDAIAHFYYMGAAYSALPGLCRNQLFRKRWREVLDCLQSIHCRVMTSMFIVKPIPSVIETQIFSKYHITRRIFRPIDPETSRLIELQKPFEIADFHQPTRQ